MAEEVLLRFKVLGGTSQSQKAPPMFEDGMYILRDLPPPGTPSTPFAKSSRDVFLKVVSAMKRVYTTHMPEVVSE